jgi:rhodanese-related sulfurtransferase
MNRVLILVAVACAALLTPLVATQADDLKSAKLRIAFAEFKKLYDDNKAVVIDVRSAEEFEGGHIPGSRSVPLDQVEARVDELKKLNRPIVVYCA